MFLVEIPPGEVPEDFNVDITVGEFSLGYQAIDEKGPVGYILFEKLPGDIGYSVHLDIHRFGHKVMRRLLELWEDEILKEVDRRGYNNLVVTYSDLFGDPEKWERFISYFGFPSMQAVYVSQRRV